MGFCEQGKEYYNGYQKKIRENKLVNLNNNMVEGFTGAFGTKSKDLNADDVSETREVSNEYNKALSKYGMSNQLLMEETAAYVNTTLDDDSGTDYSNSLIKMANGEVGYVTDKFLYKHVPSDDVLKSIQGKRGCPSTINEVSFSSDNYNAVGKTLGENANLLVGEPMLMDQPCMSTGTNLQVLGATDPSTNLADWKGCWTNTDKHFDKQDDLQAFTSGSEAIAACQLRAADTGSAGFYIGSNNSKYGCYTAKSGQSMKHIEKHSEPGIIIKKSQNIIAGPAKSYTHKHTTGHKHHHNTYTTFVPATGILNNGQVALGTILTDSENFGESIDASTIWSQSAIDNCDTQYGAKIDVQSASYGLNCDGVSENNWLKNTETAVDDNNENQKASFTISNAPGDPAYGCHKDYVSTYSCSPSTELKTISITGGATGQAAVFDCNKEYVNCTDSKLTVSDNGNVSYSRGDRDAIWESNTNTIGISVSDYKAEKGKYKRNYLLTGEYLTPGEFVGSPSGTCALICQTSGSGDNLKAYLNIVYFVMGCNQQGQDPTTEGAYGDITDQSDIQAVYSMTDGVQSNKNANKLFYVDENMYSKAYSDKDIAYDNKLEAKKMSKGKNYCTSKYEAVEEVDCKDAGKSIQKHRRWKGKMHNNDDLGGCFIGPQNWEKDIFEYKSGKYDVQYNTASGNNTSVGALQKSALGVAAAVEEGGSAAAEGMGEAALVTAGPVGAELAAASLATEVGTQVIAGLSAGVAALGSVFADQEKHQNLICQKKDVNTDNKYISIGNYNVVDSNIMTMKNTDSDSCKSKCNSLKSCGGYIYDNSTETCDLRHFEKIFPENPNRVSDPNKEMFVRQLQVSNPNSCSSQVNSIGNNIFSAMKASSPMDKNTQCDLAKATEEQRKIVDKNLNQLNKVSKTMGGNINNLAKTNKKLDKRLLFSVNQMEKASKKNTNNKKKLNKIMKNMGNVVAMEDNSNIQMISDNLQNTIWTGAVIIAVIAAIKLSR